MIKTACSRILAVAASVTLVITQNGCMTYGAIQHAKGKPGVFDSDKNTKPDGKPHPEYYRLLPLTVPADIVTSPFQLFFWNLVHTDYAP